LRNTILLSLAGGLLLTSLALSAFSLYRTNKIAFFYECEKACGVLPVISCEDREVVCDATNVRFKKDVDPADDLFAKPIKKDRVWGKRVKTGGRGNG